MSRDLSLSSQSSNEDHAENTFSNLRLNEAPIGASSEIFPQNWIIGQDQGAEEEKKWGSTPAVRRTPVISMHQVREQQKKLDDAIKRARKTSSDDYYSGLVNNNSNLKERIEDCNIVRNMQNMQKRSASMNSKESIENKLVRQKLEMR
jgi:hypothetical protein